jgi:hypothetical protein
MLKYRRAMLVLGLTAAVGVIASIAARRSGAGEAKEPCCFTNQRYTGVCQVTPAEDESCASILAYLNNPNSSGKGYCGGTSIRGGWQQVSCE